MRAIWFILRLTLIAGLLAIPLSAQAGPTTCPANSVCIDESVEGATPTVTSTTPIFVFATVVPSIGTFARPETWNINLFMQGSFSSSGTPNMFMLTEPGAIGSNGSDTLTFFTENSFTEGTLAGETLLSYRLLSDIEGDFFLSCGGVPCSTAEEDGTFQLAISGAATSAGSFDVYLKSDLEAVPEPASLVLFGTALVGFGVMRRRRGLQLPAS